ncbi:MAG: CBS domain-containing protein [Planctomycetes bacterium]|nr:CBS domain-containing protein [Planctomycetota bacterium]
MIKTRINFDLAHKMGDSLGISLPPMRNAADIMTRKIKFLTLDDNVNDFLAIMKKHKVRHVAIFDSPAETEDKPFFVGIISERDVLRFTNPYSNKDITSAQHRKTSKKVLVQLVTRNPICVSPETAIYKLIATMVRKHISMVPVLDGTELVGIITTTDILKLLLTFDTAVRKLSQKLKTPAGKDAGRAAALAEWTERTAGQIMTACPHCLALKDTMGDAIALLKKMGFRHVLVTDKDKRLTGVVSDRDILRRLPYENIPAKYLQKHYLNVPPDTPGLETPLAHIMEWEIVSVTDNSSIADVAKKLIDGNLSCLPVLNADSNISGIITVKDVIRVLLNACKPLP